MRHYTVRMQKGLTVLSGQKIVAPDIAYRPGSPLYDAPIPRHHLEP